MTIGPGTRIGAYEVVSPLGAGGMGEVFRARDTRLNREVALKVLPDSFANDPERLARFEREAQALAALKHPHIATIHGIEEKDGVRALVLELVPGESLAALIARGPLPIHEAVKIARQVADALEAAHEHGIVHRDLKPANIQITPEGDVKVLDFGLAKMGEPGSLSGSSVDVTTSPTMVSPTALTAATVLLGTAGYMAPEQARGKPIDKRVDIWAFGVVLYEMLTGTRAFPGESVTEVAGAVIHKEPDLLALPGDTPPEVRLVVARCLQKDSRQRFRDMGDVRLTLDGALVAAVPAPGVAGGAAPRSRGYAWIVGSALAAALLAGLVVWQVTRSTPADNPAVRFNVQTPNPRALVPLIDISPDGRSLAFLQNAEDGPRLWIHSLASGESRELTAAGVLRRPFFWSADSKSIGYWSAGKLRRLGVGGGPPETIADAKSFIGGSWSKDGTIVLAVDEENGVFSVPASGGAPVRLTTVDKARAESAHLSPRFLPDGRHFLYFCVSKDSANTGVYIGSIDAKPDQQDRTRLIAASQAAVYAPGQEDPDRGRLLFLRDRVLMAQAFDAGSLRLSGEPEAIGKEPVLVTNEVFGSFGASDTGAILYVPAVKQSGSLVAVDRSGRVQPIPGAEHLGQAFNPRLSPDGRRIALVIGGDLWVYASNGTPPIKLSFGGERFSPLWTPDGKKIVYETAGKQATLFSIPSDGSNATAEAVAPDGHFHPHGWMTDGQLVAVRLTSARGDLMRFVPQAGSKPEPVQETPAHEGMSASVSPDGKWVAFDADSTGRGEIWVRPLPGPGSPIRVSPNGGFEPLWAKDGRELYYVQGDKIMAVKVTMSGTQFSFTPPVELFTAPTIFGMTQPPTYDVTADGHFVMVKWDDTQPASLKVVLNAFAQRSLPR